MFCEDCGCQLEESVRFCSNCGKKIMKINLEILNSLAHKEKVSLYVWIGVVRYQFIVGYSFPLAWGFALWNTLGCWHISLVSKF